MIVPDNNPAPSPERLVRDGATLLRMVRKTTLLQKKGRSYVGLCPFHTEKTPSFHVSQELGIYHCFGCGVSGDCATFLREQHGYTFKSACKYLGRLWRRRSYYKRKLRQHGQGA
jgi:DNA primase